MGIDGRIAETCEMAGSSLRDVRGFPAEARRDAGHELELVQAGLQPTDQKPMPSVGAGVFEIRVRTSQHQHRLLYVAKFQEAIYVLHAFGKKSQKTSQQDIELARRRFKALLQERASPRGTSDQ